MKAQFFGYNDQYGRWEEIRENASDNELNKYREVQVFYDAYTVEKVLQHYQEFFEQLKKHSQSLPDFLLKFYHDVNRRIEHESLMEAHRKNPQIRVVHVKKDGEVKSLDKTPPSLGKKD